MKKQAHSILDRCDPELRRAVTRFIEVAMRQPHGRIFLAVERTRAAGTIGFEVYGDQLTHDDIQRIISTPPRGNR